MLEMNTRISKYRKVKAKGKESWQMVLEATPLLRRKRRAGWGHRCPGLRKGIDPCPRYEEGERAHHSFAERLPSDPNAPVMAKVDEAKRKATESHHTATHLLHAALRKVLGTHVAQKGSLVNEEELRFDFSHFAKMTEEEIAAVEHLVNEKIRENIPVIIKEMPKEEAMKTGAMALFGEKYGDTVRVVIIDPAYFRRALRGHPCGGNRGVGLFQDPP